MDIIFFFYMDTAQVLPCKVIFYIGINSLKKGLLGCFRSLYLFGCLQQVNVSNGILQLSPTLELGLLLASIILLIAYSSSLFSCLMAFTVAVDFTRIYAILEIVAPYRVEDKTWIIFWASILWQI